jgi:hypothetical protein
MNADHAPQKTSRLSVKISQSVADALKELMARHQVSATEEVRRAISVWKYLDDERQLGHRILIEDENGKTQRVVFPST